MQKALNYQTISTPKAKRRMKVFVETKKGTIPKEYFDLVFASAGYTKHPKGNGYIKDYHGYHRLHAIYEQGKLGLHIDRIIRGKHVTAGLDYRKQLHKEKNRLLSWWRGMNHPDILERIINKNHDQKRTSEGSATGNY